MQIKPLGPPPLLVILHRGNSPAREALGRMIVPMNTRAAPCARISSRPPRKRLSQLPALFRIDGDDDAVPARLSKVRKKRRGSRGGAGKKASKLSGESAPEHVPPVTRADNPAAVRGNSAHTGTAAGLRSTRLAITRMSCYAELSMQRALSIMDSRERSWTLGVACCRAPLP